MARLSIKGIFELISHEGGTKEQAKEWYGKLTEYYSFDGRMATELINKFSSQWNFCGCESLTPEGGAEWSDCRTPSQYWLYANSGDTYAPTLIWSSKTGKFTIGCWGDIAEKF